MIGKGIDMISSDHNGFRLDTHKQLGKEDYRKIPNGSPGIEHRFGLMYSFGMEKGMSLSRFVELVCTNPAKIFGLYPQKGTIAPGSDGDLVIMDPYAEQTITAGVQFQSSDYTPYEGFKIKGKIEAVLSRGEIIVNKGAFVGGKSGKFLPRR